MGLSAPEQRRSSTKPRLILLGLFLRAIGQGQSPQCRSADLADMRQLDLRIDLPMLRVTEGKLFPDWKSALATLRAAASAVK
jgi:hypothetical protein